MDYQAQVVVAEKALEAARAHAAEVMAKEAKFKQQAVDEEMKMKAAQALYMEAQVELSKITKEVNDANRATQIAAATASYARQMLQLTSQP